MQADNFYHIYNRANGKEKLFLTADNYYYFLKQWIKYINPIAETYAYCLIPNHFHFVILIKSEEELKEFFSEKRNLSGLEDLTGLLSKQFSNLFNSYAKAFNKQNNRNGSLFQRPFKYKIISDKEHLQQVILYVHLNPIKHQIAHDFESYPFSSYMSIISEKLTLIKRKEVIGLFDEVDNFKFVHEQQKIKIELINKIIGDDN